MGADAGWWTTILVGLGGAALAVLSLQVTRLHLLTTPRASAVLSSPGASVLSATSAAALCAATTWHIGQAEPRLAVCWLAGVAPALAAVDVLERRLPNLLTLGSTAIVVGLLTTVAAISGSPDSLITAGEAATLVGGSYLLLSLLTGGGVGAGDIKLATLIGLATGPLGIMAAIDSTFLGFLIAGAAGAIRIASRRQAIQARVAVGPSMLCGAFVAVLLH